ncbi:MAG: GTPase Era [Saccharofermentanales bacterium]
MDSINESMNDALINQPENSGDFRSGFVAITGRPNAGKSTLINQLASMDLAITSPKPQTTRTTIRAVINKPNGQIILVDTPGLLRPQDKLGKVMADAIARTVDDADIVLLLVDAEAEQRRRGRSAPEMELLTRLKDKEKEIILVLNKVDLIAKELLLPLIARWSERYPFAAIIPVSARNGDGIQVLENELLTRLPVGPRYFPEDSITDQTERSLAAELIREQILRHTHQEIPHGTAVIINSFEEEYEEETVEPRRTFIHIDASILTEKDTHKGILIGKGGSMLKAIGTDARLQIEKMVGCKVYLELHVKVREDWQNRSGILRDIGYLQDS